MARSEQDREDLMREATALLERIELQTGEATVVIGFRANGAASAFFDADLVFQFNSQNELRRAFVESMLLKAENRTLVRLDRQRTADATVLLRSALSADECTRLLSRFENLRQHLLARIEGGQFTINSQVPAASPVLSRVRGWLESLSVPVAVANSARVA